MGVASSSLAQRHPLLGDLEPRSWRSMGLSVLMPRRKQSTPMVNPEMYFMMLEKPPYHDIHDTLCGEHSVV
ncbi:hypothetical protein HAX54_036766 [Datura stramonium]|uniref:Uncharacterized protein n=1 Tax=Datura stramonium TaxID=4076 RepID=A0ABS8VHC7_DATST|nr:hypothetical protein [Datura stramonium]